ncbi:CBS domain-containing protein [Methanocaldococcus infernus]|uniref:Signal transduction protein with CBS domains n=1 Tax=Methanocaldococcus infernus (strain DSM 11812 / JCM 15783 / ME) TaxID=573063 RepID=D5VSH1_METIM|nr:CBS domain-containing protein [Methanocaldococcus infernus]ADG13524.1 putative signal transduction protein with CBS domains [Methanocaldococcus infernus ME]
MNVNVEIPVYEVMSVPVYTVSKKDTVYDAANIMCEKDIGAVVVVENKKPVGILTERDILKKVVAKNLKPKEVLVEEVMTKNIITIPKNTTLTEAAKIMSKHNVKRLPVVENNEVVGIITQDDIVRVSPKIIEILQDYIKISEPPKYSEEEVTYGICESCGAQGRVRYYQGKYLCEECLEDYKED